MRPNNDATFANVGRNQGEIKFGLDASATAHIISVLTDLYSDPVKAVIREYSTNALDSHIDAKNLAPIQVTLPTQLRPEFKVQDFGLGLNTADLEATYSLYGRSTKRDSDDVNGVLGLGCKSALTYASSFNVTAVKDGVKTLATIAKDADGVGVAKILDVFEVDEPNGVTITIPVSSYDINSFQQRARDFYRYWGRGTVLVNGEQPETIWDDPSWIWLDDDVAVSRSTHRSFIVQHNVAYPVDSYRLGSGNLGVGVVAFVPSGTVNFTPSREALHYTQRTEDTLAVLSEYVKEALTRRVQESFETAPTPYEKLVIYSQWRSQLKDLARTFWRDNGQTDGYLKLNGSSAWKYNPNGYHRKSSKTSRLGWLDLIGNETLVVDYPFKGISAWNRDRLDTHFDRKVLLIPEGTDLSLIEGRPNVVSWTEVDAATKDVPKPPSYRKGSKTTVYDCRHGRQHVQLTASELADYAEDHGLTVLYNTWDGVAGYLPDAVVAIITDRQVAKFERLFPGTRPAYVVRNELIAEVEASIGFAERLKACSTHHWVTELVAELVEDPELRQIAEAAASQGTDTYLQALALGLNLPADEEVEALLDRVDSRYPLIATSSEYEIRHNPEDALLYVNAKHQSTNTEAKEA